MERVRGGPTEPPVWAVGWLLPGEEALTSEASWNFTSYMRTSPLGCGGSGQRRKPQSSWPSQATGPGMSSALSVEDRLPW